MCQKSVSLSHLGPIVKTVIMKGPIVPNCLMSQRTAKLAKIRAVYLDLLGLAILAYLYLTLIS